MTRGGGSGILSKLFGTTGCEPQKTSKKRRKKWLTNERRPDIIAMFRRERRAPCKLNNVTKRKHQTDASFVRNHRRRTKEPTDRVESITGPEANKKLWKIAL